MHEAAADPRLLDRWAELESNALEPNLFLAPQMVLPAARYLEDGRAARLLVAQQGGELRFLLPVSGPPGLRRTPIAGLWRRRWSITASQTRLGSPSAASSGVPRKQ